MTKIDIISGFLGAGKTTLIKKLLAEAYDKEKLVLIENEFGEISIDGGFLKESGVQISEMSAGCICCSLVGDFGQALKDVEEQFHPDRILIEPSGVGKLSDVILAVKNVAEESGNMELNSFVTVADASKCKMYMKNFGEFYNNQVESAGAIILSRTQKVSEEKLNAALELLRTLNPDAPIITTPWDEITGKRILAAMEQVSLADELLKKMKEEHEAEEAEHEHEHEHHHHEHHHHDEDEHEHHEDDEHEHHHHEEHEEHEHHHDHGEHHEHHHHHADEVFDDWGCETTKKFTKSFLENCLKELDTGKYGAILRSKGILASEDEGWLEFDYVPEEWEVRKSTADYTGRLCVIGSQLKEKDLKKLFGV